MKFQTIHKPYLYYFSSFWHRIQKTNFSCYNCGEPNSHFSRHCPNLEQQFNRCPECNVVARSPAWHKLFCKNLGFVSTKTGDYEQPLMKYNRCRLIFKNVEQIFCAQSTITGDQHFLLTKFFSLGTNVHFRKVYGSKDVDLDMKFKPTITLSIGRIKSSEPMVSMMLVENQIRLNHYHVIDEHGNVSYSLLGYPRKDKKHDIELKISSKDEVIFFTLCWNNKINANVAMSDTAVTVHGPNVSIPNI